MMDSQKYKQIIGESIMVKMFPMRYKNGDT